MKKIVLVLAIALLSISTNATIHVVRVWDGYFQFNQPLSFSNILLGDTIQWLPLDPPSMTHTITSTNIPIGAATFDQIWKLPADTFFQYIPQVPGLYNYVCTPHAPGMAGAFFVLNSTDVIENKSATDKFQLYPNPASENVSISNLKVNTNFRIYDIKGKTVKVGSTINKIDISELNKGIYFIELIGSNSQVLKMVKL